jgi:hypothetical protein
VDEEQRKAFEQAVERSQDEARRRSEQHQPVGTPPERDMAEAGGDQDSLVSDARKTQDVFSVRDKNSGKGRKTADKWNQ